LRPDGDFPGILFLTDVWGVRPANIGMAKRLAEKGFAVLLPNVFTAIRG
jgi:carboxymethylenebutenolidase